MKHFLENWESITSDKYILDIVKHGLKLQVLTEVPHREPFRVTNSTKENGIMSQEINKRLKKKVIVQTIAEKRDFFSSVFLRVKKGESYRMILNLKKLNKYIDSKHFKWNLYRMFCIWSSQGFGWLLWISKMHMMLSLSMRNIKIFKVSLRISPKTHSYA